MKRCSNCGRPIPEKEETISTVIDYEYLADKLNIEGRIKYIEIRDEYGDFIIVSEPSKNERNPIDKKGRYI